jgi:cyclophilin family peptidyl-prolyl cis-trans isomerase
MFIALVSSGLAGTLAEFHTAFGDIEVELYDQEKPATVQNFIRYVRNGLYTNDFCHRLVPGFVAQAGGYAVTNGGTTNWAFVAVPTYPPVTNEFNTGTLYSNVFGTIAMAKTSDPNSATSQFFFNLADNSAALDNPTNSGGFTVFGQVVAGTNVLAQFNTFQYWTFPWATEPQPTNLVLYDYFGAPLNTLPLLYPDLVDSNLVYMAVSLLTVQAVAGPDGACEISWNSAAGMTNYVDFTTNLPAVWQTLCTTNGTGGPLTITDSTSHSATRFYRVRVAD